MKKLKIFFLKLEATVTAPGKAFRAKAPLASFITGRILTMLVLLFLLGFALFGLMELAPGDIVDQMMTQQLLTNTDMRIQEIAEQCGYNNESHFMRQFKEKCGMTAIQYRKQNK